MFRTHRGRNFPVNAILPVPGTSRDVDIQIEAGPGGGKRATQREMLREYALKPKNTLPTTGLTLARVIQEIKSMQHAETTMDVYGPSRTGRYTSFLKLFPKLFEIVYCELRLGECLKVCMTFQKNCPFFLTT